MANQKYVKKALFLLLCVETMADLCLFAGPLHDAAKAGDCALIEKIVAQRDNSFAFELGAPFVTINPLTDTNILEGLDEKGRTPIGYAIINGHTDAVKLLLALNPKPPTFITSLIDALEFPNTTPAITTYLNQLPPQALNPYSVDYKKIIDRGNETLFNRFWELKTNIESDHFAYALEKKQVAIAKKIASHCRSIDLIKVIDFGDEDLFNYFWEKLKNLNYKPNEDLAFYALQKNKISIAKKIGESLTHIIATKFKNWSRTSELSDYTTIFSLMKAGILADKDYFIEKYPHAFHELVAYMPYDKNYGTWLEALLECFNHKDILDKDGNTALYLACKEKNVTAIRALAKANANPNTTDKIGNSPLHLVCTCSNFNAHERCKDMRTIICKPINATVVDALLKAKANPNATDRAGNTALHLLCTCNNAETIKAIRVLLESVANPNIVNLNGDTPLTIMMEKKPNKTTKAIIQRLREAGAKAPDSNTASMLWQAILDGDLEAVKKHLKSGIDLFYFEKIHAIENALGSDKAGVDILKALVHAGATITADHKQYLKKDLYSSDEKYLQKKRYLETIIKYIDIFYWASFSPSKYERDCREFLKILSDDKDGFNYVFAYMFHMAHFEGLKLAYAIKKQNPTSDASRQTYHEFQLSLTNKIIELGKASLLARYIEADWPIENIEKACSLLQQNSQAHMHLLLRLKFTSGDETAICSYIKEHKEMFGIRLKLENKEYTPLEYAVIKGYAKVVELLIALRKEPSESTAFISTALNYPDNTHALILYINQLDYMGPFLLCDEQIFKKIIDRGSEALFDCFWKHLKNFLNEELCEELAHYAFKRKQINIAQKIIIDGNAELCMACKNKDKNTIENLLKIKTNPNIADKQGNTPLTIMMYQRPDETTQTIIKLLRDAGAKIPDADRSLWTHGMLWLAIQDGDLDAVKKYLKSGITIDFKKIHAIETVLLAEKAGVDILKALFRAGAIIATEHFNYISRLRNGLASANATIQGGYVNFALIQKPVLAEPAIEIEELNSVSRLSDISDDNFKQKKHYFELIASYQALTSQSTAMLRRFLKFLVQGDKDDLTAFMFDTADVEGLNIVYEMKKRETSPQTCYDYAIACTNKAIELGNAQLLARFIISGWPVEDLSKARFLLALGALREVFSNYCNCKRALCVLATETATINVDENFEEIIPLLLKKFNDFPQLQKTYYPNALLLTKKVIELGKKKMLARYIEAGWPVENHDEARALLQDNYYQEYNRALRILTFSRNFSKGNETAICKSIEKDITLLDINFILPEYFKNATELAVYHNLVNVLKKIYEIKPHSIVPQKPFVTMHAPEKPSLLNINATAKPTLINIILKHHNLKK